MTKRLESAEAEARSAVDAWIARGAACASYPGLVATQMFEADQQLVAQIAQAYQVDAREPAGFYSACGLAWARASIDAAFGLSAWMMPWGPADIRTQLLQGLSERFGEAAITSFRARSPLA